MALIFFLKYSHIDSIEYVLHVAQTYPHHILTMIPKSLYAKLMCQDVNPISCQKKKIIKEILRYLDSFITGMEKLLRPVQFKSLKDSSVFIKY